MPKKGTTKRRAESDKALKVQFRADALLLDELRAFADKQQIEINQVAKRLVTLCVFGLPAACYPYVAELAAYLGTQPYVFTGACTIIRLQLQKDTMHDPELLDDGQYLPSCVEDIVATLIEQLELVSTAKKGKRRPPTAGNDTE